MCRLVLVSLTRIESQPYSSTHAFEWIRRGISKEEAKNIGQE